MVSLRKTTRRVIGLLAVAAAALLLPLLVGAASARVQAPATSSPRVAMVVMDMSKALTGAQTEEERMAALHYAEALPSDVRVGLVAFSSKWRVALAPTADRQAFQSALFASYRIDTTAVGLYGAVAAAESAVRAAGGAAGSRLLVLSEGEEVAHGTPALAFPVDVITWYNDADDNTPALRALASSSGGGVVAQADSAALATAFTAPQAAAHPSHAAAKSSSRATVADPSGTKAAGSPAAGGSVSSGLLAVLAVVFVALLFGALLLTGTLRGGDRGRRLADQLDRYYTPRHGPGSADEQGMQADGKGKVASVAVGSVGRLLGPAAQERLALRLDLAGIRRKPSEWVVLGCCAGVLITALLTVLTQSLLVGVVAGALVGWLGMRLILNVRIARRRAAFADQLPDVLQMVAGSLQSGFSLPQALDAVVRDDTQPAAGEFSRALGEHRIGGELEAALERVAERLDSTDMRWTVMAIRIQRSVGGNLVEVLRNTVDMMRERAKLRRHVRALSAEGRLSAYILIALPLLVGTWLLLSRRTYMRPLYTTPFGLTMLIGAALLLVVGTLWMRKAVKVEV
jgi:tight adherence protein B